MGGQRGPRLRAQRARPPSIFLSYRRDDSAGFAGRLYDDLTERLPGAQIFMDVDTIQAGEDFVEAIERAVGQSGVVLVLIGPRWLDAADATGMRRIDNELDYVRLEIEGGLRSGKRVIPVLLQGAAMPRAAQLPESLRPLARRQAVSLSHARWRSDLAELVEVIEGAPTAVHEALAPAPGAAAGVEPTSPRVGRLGGVSLPLSTLAVAVVLLAALLGGGALAAALVTTPASPSPAVSAGPSVAPGGSAAPPMSAFGVPCTIWGTEESDAGTGIEGTAGDDVVCGLGGDDLLVGGGGDDLIDGGLGRDRVTFAAATGAVVVDLSTGIVSGADGDDRLQGIEGVMDSPFADRLTGTIGGDTFWLHGGADVVDGGAGLDAVDYAYAAAGECADDSLAGIEETYPAEACTLSSASPGADSPSPGPTPTRTPRPLPPPTKPPATATPPPPPPTPNPSPMSAFGVPCTIVGTQGNDEGSDGIQGTSGDDVICGLGGRDLIVGNGGNDRIDGGPGTDRVSYAGAAGGVTVNLGSGLVSGAAGNDQLKNVEGVMDSTHDDTLIGGSGNDYFWLHAGSDQVDGKGGTDAVDYCYSTVGEEANDTLVSVEEVYPVCT